VSFIDKPDRWLLRQGVKRHKQLNRGLWKLIHEYEAKHGTPWWFIRLKVKYWALAFWIWLFLPPEGRWAAVFTLPIALFLWLRRGVAR
jgi:hypothetical protein